MDDTGKHPEIPEDEIENTTIEDLKNIKWVKDFNSNYIQADQERAKSWSSISKIKAHTSTLIYIHNGTKKTFSLAHSSWDSGEFEKEDYDILPAEYMAFTLRSEPPRRVSNGKSAFQSSQVNHYFTYQSGEYAFKFSASLKLRQQYSPLSFGPANHTLQREFSVQSIGKSKLICFTDLDRHLDASPYSSILIINLRD